MTDEQLDARLSEYLTYRANLTARTAATAEQVTATLAVRLGLAGPQVSGGFRAVRLVLAILLLILALLATAVVGGLFRERYAPQVPLLEVNLAGDPWSVATAYRSLWVGPQEESLVYRLDPGTGVIQDSIQLLSPSCGPITPGFGALWFATCRDEALNRLDVRDLTVTRMTGFSTYLVGVGADSIWTAHDGLVARLNPRTLETRAEIDVGGPAGLTYGEGSVWAMVPGAHTVTRIDPSTNEVVATITLPDQPTGPAYPVHGVTGDGALWVVDELSERVYRIDAETQNAQILDLRLEFPTNTTFGQWVIGYGRGRVWVRQSEMSIVAIDTDTLQVVETHATTAGGGGAFSVSSDALWVGNNLAGSVTGEQLP